MTLAPPLLATDLEGILLPEIWIAVAERTGIEQLRLTTREIADYDELMRMRLDILRRHKLGIHDIQSVIAEMDILPGAQEFLAWVKPKMPLIIITDSFYELVAPFQPKLGFSTVFAHSLQVDEDGMLAGYRLRTVHGKRKALAAFRELGFRTMAVGDSYNDVHMLMAADHGVLFHPPANVVAEYPQLTVTTGYAMLQEEVSRFLAGTVAAGANQAAG